MSFMPTTAPEIFHTSLLYPWYFVFVHVLHSILFCGAVTCENVGISFAFLPVMRLNKPVELNIGSLSPCCVGQTS